MRPTPRSAPARRAWVELRRLVDQATGTARWEGYLDRCRAAGAVPMDRREYERHRSDHRERTARGGCC